MSERKKPVFLTEQQKQEIIESKLPNVEIARIYNSNIWTVSKIRIKAGVNRGTAGKIGGSLNCKLNDEHIKEILGTTTSNSELALKLGVHRNTIWQIRKKNGFKFPEKEPKPIKAPKVKAVKEKIVKPKKIKEIKPVKIPKKPKTINFKKTRLEEENELKNKALKAANDCKMTESEKLANGYKWVMGDCRSMVLRKIN